MHLRLKKEATKPSGQNLLQQQEKFDAFIDEFSTQGSHQAINMKYPNELYRYSPRPYKGVQEIKCPFHDRTVTVTMCGRICFKRKKININTALAGQDIGVKEIGDGVWLITFMNYDLGFFDLNNKRIDPCKHPFAPEIA
jgi:hypothetical protein